jgi:hypothetical protein
MPSTVAVAPGPNISGIASGTKAASPADYNPPHAERHLEDLQQQGAKVKKKNSGKVA